MDLRDDKETVKSKNSDKRPASFGVTCCDVRYDFRKNKCSVRLYLQLFVGGRMSYLRYTCVLVYSGVHHILGYVFAFLRLVSCVLCLVHPMIPVPLGCQFVYCSFGIF